MTNETTYREKGRALFLAAMMVLSVVAMSAAFAGAAAADTNSDLAEETGADVAYDDYSALSDAWIGQEITVAGFDDDSVNGNGELGDDADGEYIEIREGADTSDGDAETITSQQIEEYEDVDGEDHYAATFNTDELEDGEPYHIVNLGLSGEDRENHAEVFNAETEDLEVTLDSATVQQENNEDLIEIESDRSEQDLNVTAEDFDADDLEDIFDADDENVDDDNDVVTIEDVTDDDSLDADFSDVDTGEYEFTFEVTDTGTSDDVVIPVTDEEASWSFDDIEHVEQGEIAEIPIETENTDEAIVELGEDTDSINWTVPVENIEDNNATLEFNTADVDSNDNGWSVADDDADIGNVETEGVGSLDDDRLPVYTWELAIGQTAADDDEVFLADDFSTLEVGETEPTGNISLQTAPSGEVESYEDYNDSDDITETDTLANEDQLFISIDDYGIEGEVESLLDGEVTDAGDLEEELGINIELSEESSGPVDSSTTWFSNDSADGDDDQEQSLDLELLNTEAEDYDGEFILKVNVDDTTDFGDEENEGTSYDGEMTIDDGHPYIEDEDDSFSESFSLDFVERTLEFDDIDTMAAEDDATLTGTSSVAPGTNLDATAQSPGEEGGFYVVGDGEVVASDEDDHTAEIKFDLEGEDVGALFDIQDIEADDGPEADDIEDIELTEGDEEPEQDLDVDVDTPTLTDEESGAVDVTVSNNLDDDVGADVTFTLDGEDHSEELSIDAEGDDVASFDVDGEDLGAGDHDISINVTSDDAEDPGEEEGTLSISEAGDDDDDDSDDSDDSDDDGDDDTPGFGVAVAVVALLGAAMLALRQQN
ncbi:PGF-CTERM protein/surface glycoprotein [Natronorubrum sediminis]|uniref:PGF-CTERM protein/surface glycoprotein n=1 Tax=Natronorubrum sediminis TaxID=640943 RepID=A0A1H6FXS4_9EURY|nr:PGF-CTERM sorting domain-containing protein [Natronorubrum sediminis]SEH15609.1 PGF-CTERM protein/surface glycoprotein [Natronorubrum sediminis]